MAIKHQGYIILPVVLVFGVVALSIGVYLIIGGLNFSKSAYVYQQSVGARGLADACAERGLEMVRDNQSFSGSGNVNFTSGSCSYSVTSQSGENRIITATGTSGNSVRKVKVVVDAINPQINAISWQEVADL